MSKNRRAPRPGGGNPKDGDGDGPTSDARLLDTLASALTEDGELLPTTEDEVARLEAELAAESDLSFPERLREPPWLSGEAAPPPMSQSPVAHLDERRARRRNEGFSPWTHIAALALGAAAAAAFLVGRAGNERIESAQGDPAGVPSPSASSAAKLIELDATCTDCCAGASCTTARAGLERCPSGATCASCGSSRLSDSHYRLRLAAVAPSELGLDVLKLFPQGEPELCVRAGVAREQCMPAQITAREGAFAVVPGVFAGADLAAKVSVRLRWKGVAREALATAGRWMMPLALTPKALCVGYAVNLQNDDGEIFGTTSLFIDAAQHVEIMRAESTGPLRDLRSRLSLRGAEVVLRESEAEGERHFVLSVGPFDKKTAEALRWQLLEQSMPAQITDGLDFRGEPLPLP